MGQQTLPDEHVHGFLQGAMTQMVATRRALANRVKEPSVPFKARFRCGRSSGPQGRPGLSRNSAAANHRLPLQE